MWKNLYVAAVVSVASLMLAGCVDDSSSSSKKSSSSSGSGGSCGYTDLVSASERQAANSCGMQVSTQFAAADAYLDAAIESCKAGYKTEADSYYESYKKQVQHARTVYDGLCGGSGGGGGGSFDDTSTPSYYNLCVARTDTHIYWSCRGPVQYSDTSCPTSRNYNLTARYSSMSACESAARSL